MSLPEVSIKRPVFATMMSLALVLFGLIGFQRLSIRELPDIDPPVVNVSTVYFGANPEVMETEVTELLEEAINSVEGLRTLTSTSRDQVSSITIEFELNRDLDVAAQDVRDAVNRVRGRLPPDVEEPVINKQTSDARPLMWISLFSERYTPEELTDFVEEYLEDPLESINGVSSILVGGRKTYAVRIWLDPQKMAAHRVTVLDVETALRNENLELPSGRVENRQRELSIQTLGQLQTPEEFNRLVIREDGDRLIRLQDVGQAMAGVEDERSSARFRGQPAVGIGIIRQSKANTVDVADAVKAEFARLQPSFPEGLEFFYAYDESVFVKEAIREVWITLGMAFVLVVLTIFIFLRNVRTTLVPAITIPVSIIATYGFLYLMGYTINIVSMLALVLAIGVVVDDAIVVLENIYRHIEEGMKPMQAALVGMKEIIFPVIATTVALVVVFIPMALNSTQAGRLFIEFAFTICGAVIISTFVALTLAPMVASRVLKAKAEEKPHGRVFNFFESILNATTVAYERSLRWALRFRYAMVLIWLGAVSLAGYLYLQLEGDFMPDEDKSRIINIVAAPQGSTAEYTSEQVRKVEDILMSYPEIEGVFSAVALPRSGPGDASSAFVFTRLAPKEERERSVNDILNGPGGLSGRLFTEVTGALAFPRGTKAIDTTGFGQPFQFIIQTNDLGELEAQSQMLLNRFRQDGFLTRPRVDFEVNKPQLQIAIDRNRAARLDVSVREISRTLQIMFGGQELTQIKRDNQEYPVIVQVDRESRLTPQDLERLYVRSRGGSLVQLSNLVNFAEVGAPSAIYHYNRARSASIEATPAPGVTVGEAVERARAIAAEVLPATTRYAFEGDARQFLEAGSEFAFVLGIALLIVYMVLASQFESLIHPFTILVVAAPMAAVGAFGSLYVLSMTTDLPAMNINFFSQIGLLLLLALVTKNGILLIDFANQRMAQGMSAAEAMIEAGKVRLRPILMTSFSTIAGILPIAIGFGAGADSRRPLGVVAVGGMATSTVLTLLIVPIFYVLFEALTRKLGFGAQAQAEQIPLGLGGSGDAPAGALAAEKE